LITTESTVIADADVSVTLTAEPSNVQLPVQPSKIVFGDPLQGVGKSAGFGRRLSA
jgi:hypothetical protein